MTTQELIFQYWQDGQGIWQWQLNSHERLSLLRQSGNKESNEVSHRIVAAGLPCESEQHVLADINIVRGSSAATIIKALPVMVPTIGDF